jgi:hypothetical protein
LIGFLSVPLMTPSVLTSRVLLGGKAKQGCKRIDLCMPRDSSDPVGEGEGIDKGTGLGGDASGDYAGIGEGKGEVGSLCLEHRRDHRNLKALARAE